MSTEEGSQARWLTRQVVRRLEAGRTGVQQPLDALAAARHAQQDIQTLIELWTLAARREGASYARIGAALGVSGQAVRQALLRRQAHMVERAEAVQWRQPLPVRTRRRRWWRRGSAA